MGSAMTVLHREYADTLEKEAKRPNLPDGWAEVLTAAYMSIRTLCDAIDAHLADKVGARVDGASIPSGWSISDAGHGYVHIETPSGNALNIGYMPQESQTAAVMLRELAVALMQSKSDDDDHSQVDAATNLSVTLAGLPAGWAVVPTSFRVDPDKWNALQMMFGGPGTGEDEPFLHCTAWVGDIQEDDGTKTFGIHLQCDECPEEGSITIAEFTPLVAQPSVPVEALKALPIVAGSDLHGALIKMSDVEKLIAAHGSKGQS